MRMRFPILLLLYTGIAHCGNANAQEKPLLKNWFNDPFFQVRNGVSACPVPLGPLISETQRNEEAHYRVERGTSCWMEGKCSKPNSYLYDAPIADTTRRRFLGTSAFADTSLWITVQRRFVIVQGCISQAEQAAQIETLVKAVPDVERVILQINLPPHNQANYLTVPSTAHGIPDSQ